MFATITIPSPVALPEDEVEVQNYRKNNDAWERATVNRYSSVQWTTEGVGLNALTTGRWTYHVTLHRKSDRGRRLTLTVGSHAIRRVGTRRAKT